MLVLIDLLLAFLHILLVGNLSGVLSSLLLDCARNGFTLVKLIKCVIIILIRLVALTLLLHQLLLLHLLLLVMVL